MPPLTLAHDALWTSYEDVRLLVYSTCHAFLRVHGGVFEDLLSEAHDHFITAHNTWDPDRAAYTTWVRRAVWWGLLESKRTLLREETRRAALRTDDLPADRGFDLGEFIRGLSTDARTVAALALEAPQRDCRNQRRAVLRFLYSLGWTAVRIAESFSEIKEALGYEMP